MKTFNFSHLIVLMLIAALAGGLSTSCSSDSSSPSKSSSKVISSFKFEALTPVALGSIDNTARTVKVKVAQNINKTALIPTILVSEKATVSPASGAPRDFTNPVAYTVTAEDGSTAVYTVTVAEDTTGDTGSLTLKGSMSENKSLPNRNSGIDYIIDGAYKIDGNALLTIEAGVKIVFTDVDSKIVVGENAGLKITGTAADPVILTGPVNNNNKGAWRGISVTSTRADNQWEYVQIINGGNSGYPAVGLANGAKLGMKHCLISGSLVYGIDVASNAELTAFENNSIENCDKAPVRLNSIMQAKPFDQTSTFSKGNENEKCILCDRVNPVDKDFTLNKLDVPYQSGTFKVNNGTLTIQPGVTIKFINNSIFEVNNGGILKAEGTASDLITFTGTSPNAGYWHGIAINNTMTNSMKFCVVEYAGSSSYHCNLDVIAGKLTLEDTEIRYSNEYGLIYDKVTALTHKNVTFKENKKGNVYNNNTKAVTETLP